jgi:hypothetical protein
MVNAKSVLWSCVAIMPLLGFGAWYHTSSGCWFGCCEANAAGLRTALAEAKVTSSCCPSGSCCPECCTPSCCQELNVAAKDKLSSTGDCCADGSCCTAAKAPAAFVCPLTGQELPCPNCCPLNGSN